MDDGSRVSLLVVIALLFMAAAFAITETALSSVSRNKIKVACDKGDVRAKKVMYALDNFERALTTLLICTNIVYISAASIVTVTVTKIWGLNAVSASTVIMTIILFFAGEMLPKSIAKKCSFKCILAFSGMLKFFMTVFYPFASLLSKIGNFVSRLTKEEPEASVTEEELYDIIEDMEEEGSIDEEQSDLFSSALQFSDVTAESVLTPRVDIEGINADDTPEEVLDIVRKTGHSRLPVYKDSLDNIIGVLQIRKYLKEYLKTGEIPDVMKLKDRVYYAHQSTPIDELLDNMSRKKMNMTVITDSFGGTLGIVTIEDILEELVGEIWDEDDKIKEPIVKVSPNTYLIGADETVADALDFMDVEKAGDEEEERFKNLYIGEWAYEQFNHIPTAGESFEYKNVVFHIAEMHNNRIMRIRAEVKR